MRRRQLTLLVAVASLVAGCSGSAATPTSATAAPPVASSTSVAPSETPSPTLTASPSPAASISYGVLHVSTQCDKAIPAGGYRVVITYSGVPKSNAVWFTWDAHATNGYGVLTFGSGPDPATVTTAIPGDAGPNGIWVVWANEQAGDPDMVHAPRPAC